MKINVNHINLGFGIKLEYLLDICIFKIGIIHIITHVTKFIIKFDLV